MHDDKTLAQFQRLFAIMDRLRGPDGCPWDAAQTPESLQPYLIEEAYEVLEAIERQEPAALCEELGDLLLQIVFHARIFEERGHFNVGDVAASIADKMERRHPQIFSGAPRPRNPAEHRQQWDEIKRAEKQALGIRATPFDGVPVALPALQRARKVLAIAARNGSGHPLAEVPQEAWLQQLSTSLERFTASHVGTQEDMLGELLLALLAKAHKTGLDPEAALRHTIERFVANFDLVDSGQPT